MQYILDKNNNRANAFNKKSNYIKTKKLFNYSILKINKNKLLLVNKYELNAILRIFRDDKKEFLIKKEKLQIFINKVDEYIKEYYNKLLQKHSKITKTF
jgi:hypothetical protein